MRACIILQKGKEHVLFVGQEPAEKSQLPVLKKDRLEGLETDLMFGELLQAHITMQIQKSVEQLFWSGPLFTALINLRVLSKSIRSMLVRVGTARYSMKQGRP